jgi:hypothetical protein
MITKVITGSLRPHMTQTIRDHGWALTWVTHTDLDHAR